MIIDLTPLNFENEDILIDDKLKPTKEDIKNTDLIDLKNVNVKGFITLNSMDEYLLNVKVTGTMVLPCSRTLEPTDYDFEVEVDDTLENLDENFKKNQKTIDIFPIIWENILMEIPISIINPKAQEINLKGEGWELITDSDE